MAAVSASDALLARAYIPGWVLERPNEATTVAHGPTRLSGLPAHEWRYEQYERGDWAYGCTLLISDGLALQLRNRDAYDKLQPGFAFPTADLGLLIETLGCLRGERRPWSGLRHYTRAGYHFIRRGKSDDDIRWLGTGPIVASMRAALAPIVDDPALADEFFGASMPVSRFATNLDRALFGARRTRAAA